MTGPIQYAYLRTPKSGVYFLAIFTSADASSLLKAKSAVHKRALADSLVVINAFFALFFNIIDRDPFYPLFLSTSFSSFPC